MTYAAATRRTQVRRMREAAMRALTDYGVGDAELRLVVHEFNTTFKITTADGRQAALRINVNSKHDARAVAAEAEWVRAVGAETSVTVPVLIPTLDGRPATTTQCRGLDHPLPVVLYGWLDGRNLGDNPSMRQLEALGAAMAQLHDHTNRWPEKRIGDRPEIGRPLMGEPDLTTDDRRLTASQRSVVADARTMIDELTRPVFAGRQQLIHGDLHTWNARWQAGRLSVFDFDDCGRGVPLQDLAIAAYYQRERPDREAALLRGYERIRPLPRHDPAQYEALVAERNILLLISVLESNNADMRDFLPGYAKRSASRLRRYLKTGRFEL